MKIIGRKKINIRTKYGLFNVELQTWRGDKGYTVRVSKIPEIVTCGDTIEESKKMAREAIELRMEPENNGNNSYTKSERGSRHTTSSRV